ncbi:MAG: mechanosensitive ion channel [Mesorhizobium sp.]|nr:mechanosensitive ion channel domain-containing protein [Mesorhizobium sp.]MBL8576616.1 mechanosensitive ion channel [Mesorhizobium sp.]
MAEDTAAPATDVTSIVSGIEQIMGRFVSGLDARVGAFRNIGSELDTLRASFEAGGTSFGALALQILLVVAVTVAAFLACRRWFGRPQAGGWRRLFALVGAVIIAVVAGVIVQRLLPAEGLAVRTLRIWIVVSAFALVAFEALHVLLTKSPLGKGHLGKLARDLSLAVGWSLFGMATMATLRLWNAGLSVRDVIGTLLFVLPAFAMFALIVWHHGTTLSAAIAGSKPRARWHGWLARLWPAIVIGFLAVTFVTTQIAQTLGVPLPGGTVLATIVIVFLLPHIDAVIATRANTALEGERVSIVRIALQQTLRFAVLIVMITMLGAIWASPLASGFGINLHSIRTEALQIGLITTGAAFCWNLLGSAMGRIALRDRESAGNPAMPYSRLGTLVPLIGWVGKSAIAALAFLSILVSMGVNVWPLITGLSVFGLAIGFGSQTLVKDIVSGLFFLVDDAFRIGEYIETSGAKGTVEKISVRSVTLRNPRGPVATIPYGQISKVVNFSRDWAIEKIAFRVSFDTDMEVVRKLFKKIGQDLLANPELSPGIIETFKSQGIANVEDGTLVVRGKFTAKPADVSGIRREVLKSVHQAFRENDIRVVPKPLTGDAPAPAS